MSDEFQPALWPGDDAVSDETQAADAAYRESRAAFERELEAAQLCGGKTRKRRPALEMPPPALPPPGAGAAGAGPGEDAGEDIPIEISSADLEKLLGKARQEGRRQGIGEAVQRARAAIDARFRLDPREFVIGELPTGLDIGELLDAHNRFLGEYGLRAYQDGIDSARAAMGDGPDFDPGTRREIT